MAADRGPTGHAAHLPRCGAGRGQDLRHAQRGPAAPGPRHRRGRRHHVETHGRAKTAEQVGDLEVVPRRRIEHRGTTFEEMDLDAVLARRPEVALVDELAHTNVPGQPQREALAGRRGAAGRRDRRHLDGQRPAPRVGERRRRAHHRRQAAGDGPRPRRARRRAGRAGRHDARRRCGGAWPTATSTPRRRSTPPSATTSAPGNLGALRELALLWVADRVDDALEDYRERHGITEPWELRERVIVAITGAPGTEHLIRRAARIAQRTKGELIGVHVTADSGLTTGTSGDLVEAAPGAAGEARRRVPGGRRHRRRHRPDRRGPGRERHPDRARRQPAQPAAAADPGFGHQPGHRPRRSHRRPRHLRRRPPRPSGSPSRSPAPGAHAAVARPGRPGAGGWPSSGSR